MNPKIVPIWNLFYIVDWDLCCWTWTL